MRNFGEKFGDLVRSYRESQGLSAGELAVEVWGDEAKRSRISELENGRVVRPHAKTIDAIAGYFNIPKAEIDKCRERDPDPVSLVDKRALSAYAADLEAKLKAKEAEFLEFQRAYEEDNSKTVRRLEAEIASLRDKSYNPAEALVQQQDNYNRISDLFRREGNEIDGPRIEEARAALETGDPSLADQLLEEISANEQLAVERSARAYYARGEIAEEQVRWADAAKLYTRAAELDGSFWHLQKAQEFNFWAGNYTLAKSLGIKAKNKAFQEFGKETPEFARALNYLGIATEYLGDLKNAKEILTEALKLRRKILNENHKDIGVSLHNLSAVLRKRNQLVTAEKLQLEALESIECSLGKAHEKYATALNNLASLYRAQGKHADAEPLYQKAKDITKATLGEAHPSYAIRLNNLAEIYRAQGKNAEAEPLYLQAIEITKATLGEAHPNYPPSLNNLARLYRDEGKCTKAEPLYLQAIEILEATLGDDHPKTIHSKANYENFLKTRDADD